MESPFDLLFTEILFVLARELPISCPFPTEQSRKFLCRKMEKTRSMTEELDGEVFIPPSPKVCIFPLEIICLKFFPHLYLELACK